MNAYLTVTLGLLFALTPGAASAQVGGGPYAYEQFLGDAAFARLGYSVARAGDVNADGVEDYIIGASGLEVSGMIDAGAAYVYSGADASLLYTFPGIVPGGNFGLSVAAAGDVDGDGFDDVIIGAPYVSPVGSPNEGRAYVYSGVDGHKIFRFDGRNTEDRLGFSVAGAGDVNGDGLDDLLVSSIWSSESGLNQSGCVDLYSGANGQVLLHWDGGSPNDYFGYSVAAAGDANNDGIPDILIGAPNADPNGNVDSGRVFVYSGANGNKLQRIDGAAAFDWFGFSVAGAGDVDLDGHDDFLVGSPFAEANGQPSAGSAMVYSGANGNLILQVDGSSAGANFGIAVDGGIDSDSDGVPDLVVGATGADPGGMPYAGSATLYSGTSGQPLVQTWGHGENDTLGRSVAILPNLNADPLGEMLVGSPGLDYGPGLDVGWAAVVGYSPYLSLDQIEVSAAAGGTMTFALQFPQEYAQTPYKLLGSATGIGPTTLAGIEIPLTPGDFLWDALLAPQPPSVFAGANGTLNAAGEAICLLTLPPGFAASFVGSSFYFAAALYQPPAEGMLSSAAVALVVLP